MCGLSLIAAVSSIVVGTIAAVVIVAFLLSSAALLCWLKVQQSLDAFGLLKQTQLYKKLKSNEQPLTSPPQYRWSVSCLNCVQTLQYIIGTLYIDMLEARNEGLQFMMCSCLCKLIGS